MTPSAAWPVRRRCLRPAAGPCTVSTCDSGRMSSVSRQPGANPGTAMPGVKPCGQRMAVQPVWFRSSVAWPASRPSIAVRWYAHGNSCGGCAARSVRHTAAVGRGRVEQIFHVHAERESLPCGGCDPQSGPYREGERRTTGLVRAGRQVTVRSGDVFGGKGRTFDRRSQAPPERIPVPENDRAPRRTQRSARGSYFHRQMPRIRPACQEYWCRRKVGQFEVEGRSSTLPDARPRCARRPVGIQTGQHPHAFAHAADGRARMNHGPQGLTGEPSMCRSVSKLST